MTQQYSQVNNLQLAQSTNSTDGSFSALIPTLTRPARSATRAVFDLGAPGLRSSNVIVVYPFGGSSDDETINVKVTGWNFSKDGGTRGMWVSTLICEVLATLSSTLLGLANEDVVAAEFFADTLSLTKGKASLYQGTSNVDIARFKAPVSGFEIVELTFDLGTADTQNALVRFDHDTSPLEV